MSDFQPARGFPAWAADVSTLADTLGIERVAVLGGSGGGPYALACAYYIPERLTVAGVASGNAPLDLPEADVGMHRGVRLAISVGRRVPLLLGAYFSLMATLAKKNPERVARFFEQSLPPADRAVLQRSAPLRTLVVADYIEAARQGGRGFAWDFVVMARPWGFDLSQIGIPVHFWHGEDDRNVPVAAARAQAAAIPKSQLTLYPGEGHFAFFTHQEEMLRALLAAW